MTATFKKESDLCAAFIEALPPEWAAYPETGGFDILLNRTADGFQIGVEAKLRLSAKVVTQAAEQTGVHYASSTGPDCRAVLIPYGVNPDLQEVCRLLGITIISQYGAEDRRYSSRAFQPGLPEIKDRGGYYDDWFEFCPAARLHLPDWIPDVAAGASAPMALTHWKIRAIKIAVTLEKEGFVTRQDFKHFQINMSRWIVPHARWLVQDGKGAWIAGPYLPDFRKQHPKNYLEIEKDFEKWKNPELKTSQLKLKETSP